MHSPDRRIPVLYLAPWIDIGGSDTATIDWFRFLDHQRFRPSLITTQPSPNRRLGEVRAYADELWELPELMVGDEFPRFILSFIHTRGVRVLHIMNSRLGFELLPDIACLPIRPRVVVQLHGEEPRRAGYVRYVTTRYGNLVDAFSIATQGLRDRLGAYDVPSDKSRTIPIGVDAEREFSAPDIDPIGGLDVGVFHILFAARLTAQKDPLLMVEVAARLRATGLRFQIHVLGDGDLDRAVRERVAACGLQREVILRGAQLNVPSWYAACEAALLTSDFETGPPRAAYEAMAMRVPMIAPDLPALGELVTPETGVLVPQRRDPQAYADAIAALATDPARRRAVGEAARARVRASFSVERMASEHGALYEQLLSGAPSARPPKTTSAPLQMPALRGRQPQARPLVTVIITCFNQGRYLRGCLRSIARQTYRPIETIVVDDGSTDAETAEALLGVEQAGAATVLALHENRGPSAARNAGIAHARGRYLLPLDGDDLLVETAVEELVAQLGSAGERVGFIYPNLQFFGNRNDYLEMPSYNLYALLSENHCAIASLIDGEVFDRGLRYAEEITLGHEDWDFVLTLAERGIYGEVANAKTMLCRKQGFTRSDLVEATRPFSAQVATRHPSLYTRQAAIKSEWNPALTLIALDPLADDLAVAKLVTAATRQTCSDFELVVCCSQELRPTSLGRRLRRVPSELADSRGQALAYGLEIARGRYGLAAYGCADELLADSTLIEKVLRILGNDRVLDGLAFADHGPEPMALRILDREAAGRAQLGALCWRIAGESAPPASLPLHADSPLEPLARWLGAHVTVQWRHLHRPAGYPTTARHNGSRPLIRAPRNLRASDAGSRELPAALPEPPPGVPNRLARNRSWTPPQSRLLYRHRHRQSGRYMYSNEASSPPGCELDHVMGCVAEYPFPGTVSLLAAGDGGRFVFGTPADLGYPALLGFVEQHPLPLLDALLIGRHEATGQQVLTAGEEDPLEGCVQDATLVGYLEPYPIRPRASAHADVAYGLAGLVRTVDLRARRHRYGAGHPPPGIAAGELGALFTEPTGECDPLWIDTDGRVHAAHLPPSTRPSPAEALQWARDPLTWRSFSSPLPRLRASARRAFEAGRLLTSAPNNSEHPHTPAGYLLRSPTSRTVALHAAIHQVTGDQLLTTEPSEATALGYDNVALLGHLVAQAPVTGKLGLLRPAAPWALRFGLDGSRS